jgi:superfamily II DNA or RNA helicase
MSFKEIVNLPLTIATPGDDPYSSAIIPLLKESTHYERGVAFFHSEWIDLAKDGLVDFVEKGGRIKLLTSIKVDEDEFNAIRDGYEAKTNDILKKKLFDEAVISSEKHGKQWTLKYMSWLICENILELKISVHKSSSTNIYHNKVSFFTDKEGNRVCIHGTLNDSTNATGNQELLVVYRSWNEEHLKIMNKIKDKLDDSWNDKIDEYITLDLPEIVKLNFNQIQDSFNPYSGLSINKEKKAPRDYQNDAIESLRKNGFRGLLSMATGTGKTLTSLFAAKEIEKEEGHQCVCVVVPQITLIEQWYENIKGLFPSSKILICALNKNNWYSQIKILGITFKSTKESVFLITTYDNLTNEYFKNSLKPFSKRFVYIFDECHSLGSKQLKEKFVPVLESKRIGLSATPERWFDDEGTDFVKNIIGDVVYEYTMEMAIERKKLCKYNYHIILSELNDDEMHRYLELSKKISVQAQIDKTNGEEMSERMESLTMDRARISKKCLSKWPLFFETFGSYDKKKGSLVYVFDKQVNDMVSEIKKRFGLIAYGIVAETPGEERKKILEGFNSSTIDVLVAIKCLDEGVDIPNCHTEFILASSTNPREFIQRRGRVLRTSKANPDKVATIFDFVTTGTNSNFYSNDDKLSVIIRELPRVAEFVRLSWNQDDIELIKYLGSINGLAGYQKQNPWNVAKDNNLMVEDDGNE